VRDHFDRALRDEGLNPARVHRRALLLGSHREVVLAVARGDVDVGVASRAWAQRLSLSFAPLAMEPYGLLLRARDLGAPLVTRLCEVAQSARLRRRLAAIAGYGAGHTGTLRFGTGGEEG
jgi:molybdate-binding protein